ncbi:MAG: MFS transporter [Novosphingobium sp.]
MSYLGELRRNVRPLAAASLGVGTSLPLFAYTNSVFSPFLLREFGWTRAQFALVGLTMLATLFILPFVGRFTDLLGVRRMAIVGTLLVPLCFAGFAAMAGSFAVYLVIATGLLMVGAFTSPLTYSRLIAENFQHAQGLALTIMNCTPAVLAIALVPLLNRGIETHGWRAAYLGLAGFVLVCGLAAVALTPAHRSAVSARSSATPRPAARGDYALILRSRAFWVIFGGMFLCLIQTPLHAAQMNLMLMENGLTTQGAANVVAVYALGTIIGRIACGLALDRFSTPVVTAVSMGLPALGYFLLGTQMDAAVVVTASMFLVGISVGAESDLLSFLVARYFDIRIYSTTLGLIFTCSFLASATGAPAISLVLRLTDSYAPFLFLVTGTILAGSLLFTLLPGGRDGEKVG